MSKSVGQELKSTKSDIILYLTFKNVSKRNVSIFWLNFEGERVLYKILNGGETYDIFTYVGHPWIFRDCDTDDELVTANDEYIYWPQKSDDVNSRTLVLIKIPVYRLTDRCMQVIKRYEVPLNEEYLPSDLYKQLTHKTQPVPYHRFQSYTYEDILHDFEELGFG